MMHGQKNIKFYIIVAIPDDRRNYQPKHVTVNVLNK